MVKAIILNNNTINKFINVKQFIKNIYNKTNNNITKDLNALDNEIILIYDEVNNDKFINDIKGYAFIRFDNYNSVVCHINNIYYETEEIKEMIFNTIKNEMKDIKIITSKTKINDKMIMINYNNQNSNYNNNVLWQMII